MGLDAKYSTLKAKVERSSETMLHGVTLLIDSHLHNNVFSFIRFQFLLRPLVINIHSWDDTV